MKTVNISQFRNNLSAIIAKLVGYGAVTIVDRNTPVAVLIPASSAGHIGEKLTGRLARLEKAGLIAPTPGEKLDYSFIAGNLVELEKKVDVVKMLIEDRE